MDTFDSADGTRIAYHRIGQGAPLICLPGGPMLASAYLGDLGGLSAHRELVLPDLRGTGESDMPADPATYRCDRQVEDIEALRIHLGLERIDLAAHSAGAALGLLYATTHPERIDHLVLLTPSPRVVGVDVTDDERRQVAESRRGEPWFPEAFAAFERLWSGEATSADWVAIVPFMHGRWDETTQARAAWEEGLQNEDAAAVYYSDGAFDPAAVRAALARLTAPVLVIAGAVDASLPAGPAATYAGLFPRAELAVEPGGGHYPWVDDPDWFIATMTDFLKTPA